jgi:hypothetical protein
MDFKNKTAYNKLQNGKPYTFQDLHKKPVTLTTKHIPVSSILYRSDKTPKTKLGGIYPEYMGNYTLVVDYHRDSIDNTTGFISTLTTKRSLHLIIWNLANIKKLVHHPKVNMDLLKYYLQYPNTVSPLGYLPGTNENTHPHKYVNRLMSEMICKMGFDGWIVLPKTLKQYRWGKVDYYPQEVMLCPTVFRRTTRKRRTLRNVTDK